MKPKHLSYFDSLTFYSLFAILAFTPFMAVLAFTALMAFSAITEEAKLKSRAALQAAS